jgi:hypothetical protein
MPPAILSERVMRAGLAVFAATNLVLGLWMVFDPGSFFDNVGGFGAQNDHYIRDVATWQLAMGVTAAIAAARASWRAPVLFFAVVQFVLHTINHIADADEAVADTSGWFDVVSLGVGALLLVGLLRSAAATERRA